MNPKYDVIFLVEAMEFLESLDEKTLVVSTHGIVKKTDKVPKKEMDKADKIRQEYFDDKNK